MAKEIKNQKSKVKSADQKLRGSSEKTAAKKAEKNNGKIAVTKETSEAISAKRKKTLSIDVFDTKGKVAETIKLPSEIFGSKINDGLMTQAVRVYLANQRRGTLSTKTRGEVAGSTRKIYRQKGTGRARHGAIRAPIFVHGGIALGPKPRDFSLQFPKKMKRAALFSAISSKLKENEIRVVSGVFELKPKTKLMAEVIDNLKLNDKKKKILMVIPTVSDAASKEKVEKLIRSVRNIEGISFLLSNMLNTYEVLNSKMLLFVKESISDLENFFLKPKGK